MKILCLIDSLDSGGAQRQLVGLASCLKDEGYKLRLISYFDFPFYKKKLEDNNIENKCIALNASYISRVLLIFKEIKLYRPDIVISYLDTPSIIACIIRLMGLKFKLIVSERNTTQQVTLKEKVKFYFYNFADIIVPNSFSQRDFILRSYPSLLGKTNVVTNFVDLDYFTPMQNFQYDRDQLRILVVGRIAEQKNVLRFLEAVQKASLSIRGLRVYWYGRPEQNDYYRRCLEKINELQLENIFYLRKPFSDIVSEYQYCDVFCLPSIFEGFPNVICEAMACGVPILCSNVCDNSNIIVDGQNGFLFDPLSSDMMADTIIKFATLSYSQREKMRTNSRLLALKKFGKNDFVKKYINIIDSLF